MSVPKKKNPVKILIASSNTDLVEKIQKYIAAYVKRATVYTATDHKEALFKADDAFPNVAIVDINLQKSGGVEVVEKWLEEGRTPKVSVILITEIPDKDHFVDEVLTGQVQFLTIADIEGKLQACLERAKNRISVDDETNYKMKHLPARQFLFHEGETAHSVFLVKSGELVAIKRANTNTPVILGKIAAGEFVGEMAHINNDVRSASVQAITDCELIEIARDSLDNILMEKPAWAKALIATLSKRLKSTIAKSH